MDNEDKSSKFKKIILLFMTFLIFVFGVSPKHEKNKVEAFAVSSVALAVGTVAILAVGGAIVSQPIIEEYGEDILNEVEAAGAKINDFLKFDMKTRLLQFTMNAYLKNAIKNVTVNQVEEVKHFETHGYSKPIVSPIETPVSKPYYDSVRTTLINGSVGYEVDPNISLNGSFIHNILSQANSSADYGYITPVNFEFNVHSSHRFPRRIKIGFYDNVTNSVVGYFPELVIPANFTGQFNAYEMYISGLDVVYAWGTTTTPDQALSFFDVDKNYNLVLTGSQYYQNDVPINNLNISDFKITSMAPDLPLQNTFSNVSYDESVILDNIDENLEQGEEYTILTSNQLVSSAGTVSDVDVGNLIQTEEISSEDDGFLSSILAVLTNIYNFIKGLPVAIATAFTGLADYLIDGIVAGLGVVGIDVEPLIDSIGSFQAMVAGLFSSLSSTIYGAAADIISPINSIRSALMTLTSGGYANLQALFGEAVSSLNTGLENLWEDAGAVWTGFGETLTNIGTFLDDVLSGMLDNLVNGVGVANDWLSNIYDNLVNSVGAFTGAIATGTENIITGIQTGVSSIATTIDTAISTAITSVTSLVVPAAVDIDEMGEQVDELKELFFVKIEFVTVPLNALQNIFKSPKSLYDVKFTFNDVDFYPFSTVFEPAVNYVKPFFTGVMAFLTILNLYRRFSPREAFTT